MCGLLGLHCTCDVCDPLRPARVGRTTSGTRTLDAFWPVHAKTTHTSQSTGTYIGQCRNCVYSWTRCALKQVVGLCLNKVSHNCLSHCK